MAEGGGLLNRYTGQNLYRGFESPPLRQCFIFCYLQYVTASFDRVGQLSPLNAQSSDGDSQDS